MNHPVFEPSRWVGFHALAIVLLCVNAGAAQRSPAEKAIAAARAAIAKQPDNVDAYNALALALSRRARETADTAFYDEADAAIRKSLGIAPHNFEALRARCWILLGKHEFAQALEFAKQLNARMPHDAMIYGYLVDANAELGNYDEAERAAQQMLDLSRGGIPALTRTAYLREIFGDLTGAIELMQTAYTRIDRSQTEDRAWVAVQLANLLMSSGKINEAQAALAEAQKLFPNYHYTLAALARVQSALGNFRDAAKLMQHRYELAPHPENLFDVATALHRAGLAAQARTTFLKFERLALAESDGWDNANRELITWYADYANRPSEALKIAKLEIGRRHDIGTIDAYAWALYRSGRHREAADQIAKAIAVGTTDAGILYHAAVIFREVGNRSKSQAYLRRSLETNPHSEFASRVRQLLQAD